VSRLAKKTRPTVNTFSSKIAELKKKDINNKIGFKSNFTFLRNHTHTQIFNFVFTDL
jgi:hypothetical protein